jgi:hypothetical protein
LEGECAGEDDEVEEIAIRDASVRGTVHIALLRRDYARRLSR